MASSRSVVGILRAILHLTTRERNLIDLAHLYSFGTQTMSGAYGTLGTTWGDWSNAEESPCKDCPSCGVMHERCADIIFHGECSACTPTGSAQFQTAQINTHGCKMGDNLLPRPLCCGPQVGRLHRAVGLSTMWVHFKQQQTGAIYFDLKAQCHNSACTGNPSKPLLYKDQKHGKLTKAILANQCCSNPVIQLQSIRPQHISFGSAFELDLNEIHYSHDSIRPHFRDMRPLMETIGQLCSNFEETVRRCICRNAFLLL
jgi:hypothetical protein